ncbi:MAG: hypothetical protein R6U43_03925 [Candidatus Krumholzibacteriales bacterium]
MSTGWELEAANIEVGYEDNPYPVNDIINRGFVWWNIPSYIRNGTIVEAYITVDVQDISIWNDLLAFVTLEHLGTLSWQDYYSLGDFGTGWDEGHYDALIGLSIDSESRAETLRFTIPSYSFDLLEQYEVGFSFRAVPEDPSGSFGNDTNRIILNNPLLHVKCHY